MDEPDLPPARHPADLPWWHWHSVPVRRWSVARRRGHGRLMLWIGAVFAGGQLAVWCLRAGVESGSAPAAWQVLATPPVWIAALLGGLVAGIFIGAVQWEGAERRYAAALRRREEHDRGGA